MGTIIQLNNLIESIISIATAGGTTTLVNNSARNQQFTGTQSQIVVLPDATTCKIGHVFIISNRSTGVITVNFNGGSLAVSIPAGFQSTIKAVTVSTSTGTWDITSEATGGGSSTFTVTAGENLATADAIYICWSVNDGGRTLGQAYKLNINDAYRNTYAGIVTVGVSAAAAATIQVAGEVSGFSGLLQGQPVYASFTTPGAFSLNPTSLTNINTVVLGFGSTATTKMLIDGAIGASNLSLFVPRTAGYLMGGIISNESNDTNVIQKTAFSTEVISTIGATIPTANKSSGSGLSAPIKGYACGGGTPGLNNNKQTSIIALLFSAETTSTLGAVTSQSVNYNDGGVYNTTQGYIAGGNTIGSGFVATVTKLVFSTEAASASTSLISANCQGAGVSSSTGGYLCGGQITGSTVTSVIQKILFSSDGTSTLSAFLSLPRRQSFGMSSPYKGYILMGGDASNVGVSTNESLDFTTETINSVVATFTGTAASTGNGNTVASYVKGFCQGGETGGSTTQTTNRGFVFSTETTTVQTSSLGTAVGDAQNAQY